MEPSAAGHAGWPHFGIRQHNSEEFYVDCLSVANIEQVQATCSVLTLVGVAQGTNGKACTQQYVAAF